MIGDPMIADVQTPSRASTHPWAGLLAGVGAVTLWAALALVPERAWPSLLVHAMWLLSLTLGSVFFLATQYLTKAGWSVAIRRVPEALGVCVPAVAPLVAVVLLGLPHLYHWSHPEAVAHDPLLAEKAAYLNVPGFALRMLVILGLWAALSLALVRASRRIRNADGWRRARRLSALFVPVFAITLSVASFDWLMSVEPHWFSTIYAVYVFSGVFLGGLAAITLGVLYLSRGGGPLERVVHRRHLHDLGKLLFAFSTFWAYIWVSQYLLIWYGNLPEETPHFLLRTSGAWLVVFALNVVLNWALPFALLMSAKAKRSRRLLAVVAVLLLLGRWLDLHLLVMPPLVEAPGLPWWEPVVAVGTVAALIAGAGFALGRAPLVPEEDPLLAESLHGR